MRKFFFSLGVIIILLASVPVLLIASGTTSSSTLVMLLNALTGASGPQTNKQIIRQRYEVPEGFSISLYATDLPKARFLRFTSAGDLLVSRPHSGDIILLGRDEDGDGTPDSRETLVAELNRPLGMDIIDGWLYIAQSNQIGRIPFDEISGSITGEWEPVITGLTDNGNHWSKTIRIGQDNKLYLAQGSTCNICEEDDPRRATMMRFNLDGSEGEILATGLRNSVGFDWAPWSGELFATDNGRDLMGDNFPPCELNLIEPGRFYGWPYFNGDNIPDPDMGPDPLTKTRNPTAPAHGFRAHNAPLGMTFLDAAKLPPEYERSALAALHGSWNRSTPDGYKVVSLHWTDEGIEERDFLSGFNQEGNISGRPVDVAQGPDGNIFISDDYAGAIYRVSYSTDAGDSNFSGESAELLVPVMSRMDSEPPAWLADADLAKMAAEGHELYQRFQCGSCHEEGENPKRLDQLSERMGYAAVLEILEAPPSPMPLFPLSDAQRRELAVFLLWQASNEDSPGQ